MHFEIPNEASREKCQKTARSLIAVTGFRRHFQLFINCARKSFLPSFTHFGNFPLPIATLIIRLTKERKTQILTINSTRRFTVTLKDNSQTKMNNGIL